jgi:hypothetical protein
LTEITAISTVLLLAQEAAVLVRDTTEALDHDFEVGDVAVGDG